MTRTAIFKSLILIKPSPVAGLPNENNINPRLACIWPLKSYYSLTSGLLLPYLWWTPSQERLPSVWEASMGHLCSILQPAVQQSRGYLPGVVPGSCGRVKWLTMCRHLSEIMPFLEPIIVSNRLMARYNWQQKDWLDFSYNVEGVGGWAFHIG